MRQPWRLAVLACYVLAGCRTTHLPVALDDVVGTYIYQSEDPEGRASDHNLDRLVLRSDGNFDLVEGGSTKPRTETIGRWTIRKDRNNGRIVMLDHAGYPIRIEGNDVKLLIDDDVGIWYAKVN